MIAPEIDTFAEKAATFRDWVLHGKERGASSALQALVHLTDLYAAGLRLPSASADSDSEVAQGDHGERTAVIEACKRLPFQNYSEIFDPLIFPPEEASTGWLSDDIADIFRDVVSGLLSYEAGDIDAAVWQWKFNMHGHWGEHATSAIRALHCWLARNTHNFEV